MWKYCLFFLSLFTFSEMIAQSQFEGYVFDKEEGKPLTNVNTILFQKQDTLRFLKGEVTDQKGYFRYVNVPDGEYLLEYSMLGYKKELLNVIIQGHNIQLDTVRMALGMKSIGEVVVKAELVKKKGDKESFWFSPAEKEKVSSALNLLEGIPYLSLNAMNNKIQTNLGGDILILCDGLEISEIDLMGLRSADIIRVEYYSRPPTRYANRNVKAVINILTKRLEGGYIMANLQNSFVTGFGTDILQGKYSRGDYDFSLRYFVDYRGYTKNRLNESWEYELDDGLYKVNKEGLNGDYRGQYHTVQGTFSCVKANTLFSAKMKMAVSPSEENSPQLVSGIRASRPIQNIVSEIDAESRFVSPSLDLYYSKKIGARHEIIANIVNTYYDSYSDRHLVESQSGIKQYNMDTHLDNKTYSNISELVYLNKSSRGEWSVGGRYYYKKLWDKYKTGETEFISTNYNTQNLYIYTDWHGELEKLDYVLGIGGEHTWLNTIDCHRYFVVRPSLLLSYTATKKSSFDLGLSIESNIPDISLLTNNPAYLDSTFVSVGNSALKPYYIFNNYLQYSYRSPLINMQTSISYNFAHQPYYEIYKTLGKYAVKSYMNVYNMHDFVYDLGFRFVPWKFLSITPYYSMRYQVADGFDRRLDDWNYRFRISMAVSWSRWTMHSTILLPSRTLTGEVFHEKGSYYSCDITWKKDNLSLQLAYVSSGTPEKSKTLLSFPVYYEEYKEWGNFENLLFLRLTYTLPFGMNIKRNKAQRLNNEDSDSGLYIDNKAKL